MFDICEVIEERWANWLRQDPLVASRKQVELILSAAIDVERLQLREILLLAFALRRPADSCGTERVCIAHRYEEFPDNHSGVDYRMDESLPFLAKALSG